MFSSIRVLNRSTCWSRPARANARLNWTASSPTSSISTASAPLWGLDSAQHLAVPLDAEADEHLVADLGPAGAGVAAGGGGRSPRPDVVVADVHHRRTPSLGGHPPHRGEQLLEGVSPTRKTPGVRSPFSYSGVYTYGTRPVTRGRSPWRTAEMCQPVTAATAPDVTRASTVSATRRGLPFLVDHHEPDLAPEHAALAVDLLGGQLGTGLAGRPEDPGRALQVTTRATSKWSSPTRIRSQPRRFPPAVPSALEQANRNGHRPTR